MRLHAVKNYSQARFTSFGLSSVDEKKENEAKKPVYDKNPIKKSGERSNALLATAVAGVIFGLRAMAAIADDGDGAEFLFEFCGKIARKIRGKNEQIPKKLKTPLAQELAGTAAVMLGVIGLIALVYTLYNTPKAMYDAKVNTFKKGKEMDVYIKGNAVEKDLYEQMNDKANAATTSEEKEKLNLQYAKLKMAKNVVPDFVKMN